MKVRIKNEMALLQSVLKEGLIITNKFIIILNLKDNLFYYYYFVSL